MIRILLSLLLLAPLSLSAAIIRVTNTADSGPGSLRQAMLDANRGPCSPIAPCRIEFAIPGPVPSSGWFTVRPESPLPLIDRSPIHIDATSQTALTGDTNPAGPEVEIDGSNAGYRSGFKAWATYGLVITGFAINRFEGHGIFVDSGTQTQIAHNYIGVDPTGQVARPNGLDGIALRNDTSGFISFNVISGNRGNGIYIGGGTDTTISSNRIGIGSLGEPPVPNEASGIDATGTGIDIVANKIITNRLHGVAITGDVAVYANTIFANGLLGISHGFGGGEGSQSPRPPVLTAALENSQTQGFYTGFTVVRGTIRSTPNTDIIISAYATPHLDANGRAEGRLFIGQETVRTDADGNATFEVQRDLYTETLEIYGGYATATAQPVFGTTSQFSDPIPITMTTPTFEVTNIFDSGAGSLRDAITRANAATCTLDVPCRVAFRIDPSSFPAALNTDGAVPIFLDSPLPPIKGYIRMSGGSQTWWYGDANPAGPEVVIRGGAGVQFGTETEPVTRAWVHSLAINGSSTDGLTIFASPERVPNISQARIIVQEVYSGTDARGTTAVPNAGSGLRLAGGQTTTTLSQTNALVTHSLFSGNRQHGILLGGDMHTFGSNKIGSDISGLNPLPNGDDGVHVVGGTQHSFGGDFIAFNTDDGVATEPGVRAPSVQSALKQNGGLGIDVNSDGISPSDGNLEDGTIDPPVIQRAWFDPARDMTIVEGISHPSAAPMHVPAFAGAGDRFGNVFFISTQPDPSGRGEGEALVQSSYPPLAFVEGANGTFRFGLRGDHRGKWFTGTTNRFYCYWEFGCQSRESSEFSVAVKAE
jgi:parallel beta-helix repeat protein